MSSAAIGSARPRSKSPSGPPVSGAALQRQFLARLRRHSQRKVVAAIPAAVARLESEIAALRDTSFGRTTWRLRQRGRLVSSSHREQLAMDTPRGERRPRRRADRRAGCDRASGAHRAAGQWPTNERRAQGAASRRAATGSGSGVGDRRDTRRRRGGNGQRGQRDGSGGGEPPGSPRRAHRLRPPISSSAASQPCVRLPGRRGLRQWSGARSVVETAAPRRRDSARYLRRPQPIDALEQPLRIVRATRRDRARRRSAARARSTSPVAKAFEP